jgi:predicted HAD superfamily Cof-like phosphohydrolase
LAKRQPDGTVKRRADGKVMKPDGWTPPDIAGVLERQARP